MFQNWSANFTCLYELDSTKVAIISSTFALNIFNALLLYGIIWFEHFGCDSKRMLRNRLVSANCWNVMLGVPLLHLLDSINVIIRPESETFCLFVGFARNVIRTNSLLIVNAIAVSRYFFVFWMKNPAGIDDEFWSLAITLLALAFSLTYNFVMMCLPGPHSFQHYLCANIEPKADQGLENKINHVQLETALTVLLLMVIQIRIRIYKNQRPVSGNGTTNTNSKTKLLNRWVTSPIFAVWLVGMLVIQDKINKLSLEPAERCTMTLVTFAYQFFAPCLTCLLISCVLYGKSAEMRIKLSQEVRLSL